MYGNGYGVGGDSAIGSTSVHKSFLIDSTWCLNQLTEGAIKKSEPMVRRFWFEFRLGLSPRQLIKTLD